MILRAPAKVNLGLRITGRRPDGYHELESIFVPLDLADTVSVEVSDAASPVVMTADERGITRVDTSESVLFPWGTVAASDAVALRAFDWNSDFRTDLAVTGGGDVGLFEQTEAGTFIAVPVMSANGDPLVLAEARSLWVADFEMDGDLDVLLGTVWSSAELLRNNAVGTRADAGR